MASFSHKNVPTRQFCIRMMSEYIVNQLLDVPYITAVSDLHLRDSADVLDEFFPVADQDSELTTRQTRPVSDPSNDNLLDCGRIQIGCGSIASLDPDR